MRKFMHRFTPSDKVSIHRKAKATATVAFKKKDEHDFPLWNDNRYAIFLNVI